METKFPGECGLRGLSYERFILVLLDELKMRREAESCGRRAAEFQQRARKSPNFSEQVLGLSKDQKLVMSVDVLEPSVRVGNCLRQRNIETLGELVKHKEGDLLEIKHFGKTSLKEIKVALSKMGLELA